MSVRMASASPIHRFAVRLGSTALVVLAVLSGPGSASAADAAVPRVRIGIGGSARFDQGGVGVQIPVAGRCSSGAEVLEAFIYVNQDGSSTEWGIIPLQCDGAWHRWVVLVPKGEVPLHEGPATASAYALVTDPKTGETAQDSPTRNIVILPPPGPTGS
jgi:hypothetical protein